MLQMDTNIGDNEYFCTHISRLLRISRFTEQPYMSNLDSKCVNYLSSESGTQAPALHVQKC